MNNFILRDYIEDVSVCDDLINLHKTSPYKTPGMLALDKINPEVKLSTDLSINIQSTNEVLDRYYKELEKILELYKKKYKFCNESESWELVESINIQHYAPGEGYFKWHWERGAPELNHRHLVFMTYLNTVADGGETEFYYQNLKIKPKKGLTLIWPTDFTHTHRGVTSNTQDKYIITGWFGFKQ